MNNSNALYPRPERQGFTANFDKIKHYNLDAVISVGYRVNTKKGTQFRIWATNILRQHLLNGYSVNIRKLQKIEHRLDTFIKAQTKINQQLLEDQFFIKKMLQPNPITNNIYFDTKPMWKIEKQFTELNKILKDIEKKLLAKTELKIVFKEIKNNIKKAQKDSNAKNKLLKTISDLGDANSSLSKLLKEAGITKNLIKKLYNIIILLLKHLPF